MRVLVTCPPMLGQRAHFLPLLDAAGVQAVMPDVVQTLTEDELVALVPDVDGWIIGDDPATERVLQAGRAGRLRAAVKWGIGTDNVDVDACRRLGIDVVNTPGMFGREVADIAMHYVVALARGTVAIDRGVRAGAWPKPAGMSLAGRTAALVGYGDIGRQIARRLRVADMVVHVHDPAVQDVGDDPDLVLRRWPEGLEDADVLVFACPLTPSSHHMLDATTLALTRPGVMVVNVGRGPVIDQRALEAALGSGHVAAAALDVFEEEPLPLDNPLRHHDGVVLGSHNSSNTVDAVQRTNQAAITALLGFLRGTG